MGLSVGAKNVCQSIIRNWTIKRNKKRKEETLPDGMKRCANACCNKILPLSEFESTTARRTEPTTTCTTCRAIKKKSEQNPTSTTGKCQEYWQNWKQTNPCEHEGGCEHPDDWRLIQADHIEPKGKTKGKGRVKAAINYPIIRGGRGTVESKRWRKKQKNARRCAFIHHRIKTKDETTGPNRKKCG